ncbi:MAG TPA: cytochrome P450 [Mycobacteriales bacterium]|nr:cytochrome P450 [Mycobacteriales bacterium]
MTVSADAPPYYDPYDVELAVDPYPMWRRLRDEAPVYYNEKYDFYALSRHADIAKWLPEWETFPSGRGVIIELIKANLQLPSGTLIMEDPPVHDIHRNLLVRVFTPRRIASIEPQVRAYCAQHLDPLIGEERFDLIAELGAQMPGKVIGMLLGIPEEDQAAVRKNVDNNLRTRAGEQMVVKDTSFVSGDIFGDYIDWRMKNPSNDLMTDLLTAEFEDEKGEIRKLTRQEVLTYVSVVAGAGNETTTRLIGWMGSLLAQNPDQRAAIVADLSLVPNAVEETVRYQPPGPHVARYVARDVEIHGQTVREGSVMLFLLGSANRDDRVYPDGDTFNIHRPLSQHLGFGYSVHYCMGAALARLEGTVALEEILKRFPTWEVDWDGAKLGTTSTVRGWESLPIVVG